MDAAAAMDTLKRRQALQVVAFLAAVASATGGIFFWFRRDLVAYRRGETALARRDFAGAARQLGEAWSRGYRNPRLRTDLAWARLETADRKGALVLYEQALAAAPRDERLIDTVAGLYQAEGQPARGIALYARLGSAAALSGPSLTRLGDLRQQAGDYPGAIEAYRLAATRLPREPEVQLRLGIVLSWVGQRTEAITALRQALALQPDFHAAQLELGRVLLWDGRFNDAIEQLRHALPP